MMLPIGQLKYLRQLLFGACNTAGVFAADDINAINVTQIISQVGSMPTDPYCMFGSIELDGQITIGSSTQNTLYRFSAAVLIK